MNGSENMATGTAFKDIPKEYRQAFEITSLKNEVSRIASQTEKNTDAINALRADIAHLRADIMELHIESIKHADELHAETLKQYNTIVWKTVGLLGTAAVIAKYMIS